MRDSFRSTYFRSTMLSLVVIGCLLMPAILSAADANPANPAAPASATAAAAATTNGDPNAGALATPNATLLDLLVKKGILTTSEANSLRSTSGSAGMNQLLQLLQAKGLVSDSEAAELKSAVSDAASMHTFVEIESAGSQANSLTPGQTTQPKPPEPTGPKVVPAIAPVRVLSLDPPSKDALAHAWKLPSGAMIAPYGFIKSTAAYDSYQPYGDDFIKPLFLAGGTNSGPGSNPDFHLKARSSRIGSKFEWPDVSKNITVTGQLEADFEGNFSAVDNRSVSTIRSNALQLRLAYGRIDWTAAPNSDIFFEAGQDWSIFGSSALMNLLETTFYGAYWGNVYERSPQFRLGLVQKLGGSRDWKLSPEFALMMPSEGDLPGTRITCPAPETGVSPVCTLANLGLTSQLGYGERQGADAAKPELESRLVLQFQLDKAPGVVPAQILWSGFYTTRQMTVTAGGVPAAYTAAFPSGVDLNSNGYGNQVAVSLPTRWATVVASGYMGADLRFFFGGQTLSYYNQPVGLTGVADGYSVDYNPAVFGMRNGTPTVAPQLPVRGYGGFVQAGFPLSRWFNADPKGRNAGWQAYFEYGIDAVNANDFYLAKGIGAEGAGPVKSTIKAATIFYKMNPWVQFGFEESDYSSYAVPAISGADAGICNATKVANKAVCNATDWRTEFGPIFTF